MSVSLIPVVHGSGGGEGGGEGTGETGQTQEGGGEEGTGSGNQNGTINSTATQLPGKELSVIEIVGIIIAGATAIIALILIIFGLIYECYIKKKEVNPETNEQTGLPRDKRPLAGTAADRCFFVRSGSLMWNA